MPFFSVIIPVYNRAYIIDRSIISVLEQSFNDFELIVVDDGSTDNTQEVAQRFVAENKIVYYYQNNAGVCAARNFGVQHATGKYLVFLDSDDYVSDTWLADYYQLITETGATLLFCKMQTVFPNGTSKISEPRNPFGNGKGFGIYIPGAFAVEKKLFLKVGGYDTNIRYGENTELSFRLIANEPVVAFSDAVNLVYESSVDGGSKNWRNKLDSNLYILRKHADFFKKEIRAKQLLLGVAAVAAVHCKDMNTARRLFFQSAMVNVFQFKPMLRFLISIIPGFAQRFWNR